MVVREIEPSRLSDVFREYLPDDRTIFVFSTDTVWSSWADWCVTHPELSGTQAVALDRFTAWDRFKAAFSTSSLSGKSAIPSVLRKIFVKNLLERNAKSPFFKVLISPRFSGEASSFVDWMSGILPALNLWLKKYEAFLLSRGMKEGDDEDEENQDLLLLHDEYAAFLDKNNLFDQSWVEPDFTGQNRRFVLIYPEVLQDFYEYEDLLKEGGREGESEVVIIKLPQNENFTFPCFSYPDSRKELRRTVLKIRDLITRRGVSPCDIALSVPSLDVYRPYIKREFEKYCVPFVIRAGAPLTRNCAGVVFNEINECYTCDFSFDSLRSLLLDEYIPWTKEIEIIKENLIREGNRMRCVCSYTERDFGGGKDENQGGEGGQNERVIDTWEAALSDADCDERELNFYRAIKEDIKRICEASSFKNVRSAWLIFKRRYLAEDGFSEDADKIISRCVSVLNEMAEVEEKYCEPENLKISSPFSFFLNELKNKTYTKQNKTNSVNVYPYRLTAAASVRYQFIIDSSQDNLEIPFKQLDFLSPEKRELLGLTQNDKRTNASTAFIRLYAKNGIEKTAPKSSTPRANHGDAGAQVSQEESGSEGFTRFSYAEQSFSGFAIAHNVFFLAVSDDQLASDDALDCDDFILNERSFFISGGVQGENADSARFDVHSENQRLQFERWAKTKQAGSDFSAGEGDEAQNERDSSCAPRLSEEIKRKVDYVLIKSREKDSSAGEGKITLTQSDMKDFFPCPRKWFFKKICRIEQDSLDTSLSTPFDIGNIYHKILELFFKSCQEECGAILPVTNDFASFDNENEISEKIREITDFVIFDDLKADFYESPLSKAGFHAQKDEIAETILRLLKKMCVPRENGGFGGCKIVSTEEKLDAQSKNAKWNYSGRTDCVLADETGEIYIIDFKSGETPSVSKSTADDDGFLRDFQIAMYVTLWNANHKKNPAENALFYSIKNEKPVKIVQSDQNKKSGERSLTADEFEDTLEVFEKYSEAFCEKIASENLQPERAKSNVSPENEISPEKSYNSVESYKDCAICEMKTICRTTFAIARREIKSKNMNENRGAK